MRALISVSDKTGIIKFAEKLVTLGIDIISTGGTLKALREAGIEAVSVDSVTGFKECLDGRVKTLHPNVHAGILAVRDNTDHMKQIDALDIEPIDIVVVNLYPFKQTILKPETTLAEAIENIDIGGPAMIRSAAKNYRGVAVVTDPADYDKVLEELTAIREVSGETRFYLAAKAFAHTAHYDALIAGYLAPKANLPVLGDTLTLTYEKVQDMRYGENPHQSAGFYKEVGISKGMLIDAVQLHGKALSFNNINDTHGALELLREFDEPTVVAAKHSNPCGVGSAENIFDAYIKAYACDPVSIFGGIIAANREIDGNTAAQIIKCFTEIVIAPGFTTQALEIFETKKNLRLLQLNAIGTRQPETALDLKKVSGGILAQQVNNTLLDEEHLTYITDRMPDEQEMKDLIFAWKVVKHTKSNSIVLGKQDQTVGLGIGQVNRVWACEQAIAHGLQHLGAEKVKGSVLASDAYFPFGDSVEAAAKAGVTAIIQPGGSMNDHLSIELCNEHNIAMVFTGIRHFRH